MSITSIFAACACICGGPVLCGGGSGEVAENNKGKFASYFDSN
jgi:hypothetical protein